MTNNVAENLSENDLRVISYVHEGHDSPSENIRMKAKGMKYMRGRPYEKHSTKATCLVIEHAHA